MAGRSHLSPFAGLEWLAQTEGRRADSWASLNSLQVRDRVRRALALSMTPGERLAKQAELTEALFAQLRKNPEGWERFLRRNFKKRAVGWREEGTG